MNLIAHAALLSWPLVVVVLFNVLPHRKAVVGSFVVAWLFLPNVSYDLPGLPDYTKMSATVVSVLACSLIFDQARFFAVRPRWLDLPMLAWCLGSPVTTLSNDLTPYDALAATMNELVFWGFPYLVGRIYLTDLDAMKDMAQAIAIGGICYIPLCNVRDPGSVPSSNLGSTTSSVWEGTRYGGYRPLRSS